MIRSFLLVLIFLGGCALIGANEAYLPEVGRYDYVLDDTARVTGQLVVETVGGAGIGYHWEVDAFGPDSRLGHGSQYSRDNYFPLEADLAATGELVSHRLSRDGDSYRCAAALIRAGEPSRRDATCSLVYRGR